MLLATLREEVWQANLELVRRGLAIFTFGNASGISRQDGLVAIKPSGVPYETMRPEDLVVTTLEGRVVEGGLRPSSDLATHLVLYRAFGGIGGVVHTHARYSTAWAQAGREIPCLGTTHADTFYGPIPVTPPLEAAQIEGAYEENTGLAIVERFRGLDPAAMQAALVAGHGPFCWGKSAADAAHNAVLLEEVARMAWLALALNPAASPISPALLDKHFLRKHGPGATYGQS
ncbi:MAG: L-ribulose-5-phosphate 4-epimerase [Bryobacteraceae bacterium]